LKKLIHIYTDNNSLVDTHIAKNSKQSTRIAATPLRYTVFMLFVFLIVFFCFVSVPLWWIKMYTTRLGLLFTYAYYGLKTASQDEN